MTTQPYEETQIRGYGEPAGIRLLTAMEGAGADPFTTSQAISEGAKLGLTPGHAITILHRLAAAGWLTRLRRGLYALNDPVTRLPKAHPFGIGAAMVTPSAVSHWSALQYWGMTEQIPTDITLSSPRRTYPPSGRLRGVDDRPVWTVAGVQYQFIAVARARFFGVTQVWVDDRHQVPIFDRERALLDAFHHFHIFGSISIALEILEAHLADLDIDRLAEYAVKLEVAAVVKRLGWALEKFGVAPDLLAPLRAYPAKGDSPLDPGRPARGRHNPTWHVIENLHHDG